MRPHPGDPRNPFGKGCGLMSLPDERSATSRAEVGETSQPAGPGHDTGPSPGSTMASRPSGRTWAMIVGAGLLAGLASFGMGEVAPALVSPSSALPPEIAASGQRASAEMERRTAISRDRATALAYGGLGMFLGLALGGARGPSPRFPRRGVTGPPTRPIPRGGP